MCALDVSPRPLVTLFPATRLRHFPLHLLASLLPQHLDTQNTPPPPPSVCCCCCCCCCFFPCNNNNNNAIPYVVPHLFLHQLITVTLVLVCNFCLNTDPFGYPFICMWFVAPLDSVCVYLLWSSIGAVSGFLSVCVCVCVCVWEIMTSVVRNVGASFSSNSLLQLSMSDQFCCDRLCVQRSRACCLGTINPNLLRDMISGSASCVDFGGSSSLVGGWSSSSSSSSCWGARRFGIQVRCSAPPPVAMPTTTSPHRLTGPKTRTQVSTRVTVLIGGGGRAAGLLFLILFCRFAN